MNAAAPGRMPGIGRPPICSIGIYRPTKYAASMPKTDRGLRPARAGTAVASSPAFVVSGF
jgi:hypothetical protein